ncbi:MAG TPA: transcriptional repressor [Clostridia bacterium]|jgi:Fur family ferric uptake transcriptional regulator|nr:transcriptional repressor [Clostridia bacterium]
MNDKQLTKLLHTMKEKGLKFTPAREIMLKIFLQADDKLLSAADTFDLVRKENAKINFSTVYRNLDTLVTNQLIEKITCHDGIRYKLISQKQHHHLMICTHCHKTEPLPFCPYGELEAFIKNGTDFLPTNHHVEIYGYCKNCRQELK